MERLLDHIVCAITSKDGYSALFKAGALLMSVAMIALAQIMPFLYDKDLSAYKASYDLESKTGISIGLIPDCTALEPGIIAECKMAKHELKALDSSIKLFENFVYVCLSFGGGLIFLSVVGFLCAAFTKRPQPPSNSLE